jgi:signal transduction histidine kinase
MKMNAEKAAWSRRYQAAMRKHLQHGAGASLRPALGLGRQAVALGLETLDVALIHGRALAVLAARNGSFGTRQDMIDRAKKFFAEATVPIEKTHGAALKADTRAEQLIQTLRRRTMESSAAARRVARGIAQRQAAEAALEKSGRHRATLLQESRRLRDRLRHQTREILSAQECARQNTSRQLHDEIAQTMLAINFRLLTLKKATRTSTESLKKEIAETQRVVKQSVKMINRFVHEFGIQSQT